MLSQALSHHSLLPDTVIPCIPQRAELRALPAQDHAVMTMPEAGLGSILEVISSARRRIRIKMFKLTCEPILNGLIEARRRGVDVKVLLNPKRSDGSRANDEAFETLQAGQVAVEWTNPAFYVTHEKSMVVDDLAFICTFNFADKYFSATRGYAVVSRNPQEVEEVVAAFEADWQRTDFVPNRLVWSQAGEGNSRHHINQLIDNAHSEIWIQNPKLVDSSIVDHLVNALARGVRVRFLSSGLKGLSEWDIAENSASLRTLMSKGAQVREIKKPKMHAKLVLVDGQRALVGSQNLDKSCFELRRELGVIVEHPLPVASLAQTFEADWAQSKPSSL